MTDMLERASRAIYQRTPEGEHWAVMDKPKPLFITHSWEKASEGYRQKCIDDARTALEAAFQVDDKDARIFFGHRLAEVDWHVNEYLGRRFCDGMQGLREELERTA